MNKAMTAAEVKAHLSELLDRAAAGQETVITRRGKPVAKIVQVGNRILYRMIHDGASIKVRLLETSQC